MLGGCCTPVPGVLAGLRDTGGPVGIAYVDGHVDVYDGTTSPTGEAADMPLGVALGLEPADWVEAAGGPGVAPADVVVLGARDPDEARDIADLRSGALRDVELLGPGELRAAGLAAAGARAGERLARGPGRFLIHLDVDVLDERAMPATDYLMPGGLEWDELAALLGALCASPALAGLSLGCLNPDKDPDGTLTAADRRAARRRAHSSVTATGRWSDSGPASSTSGSRAPPAAKTWSTQCDATRSSPSSTGRRWLKSPPITSVRAGGPGPSGGERRDAVGPGALGRPQGGVDVDDPRPVPELGAVGDPPLGPARELGPAVRAHGAAHEDRVRAAALGLEHVGQPHRERAAQRQPRVARG